MLEFRKEKILKLVIENYIKNAEPVGSKFLVEECGLGVSGATIRNEMRALEEKEYLTHPHTSSGRIPTEKGYKYYVENLLTTISVHPNDRKEIEQMVVDVESRQKIKNIAKYIAEKTNNAVIVAFDNDFIYYTGMSYLFAQPEFRDYAYMIKASSIFDQCDDKIDEIMDLFEQKEPKILIGATNPFGQMTSMVGVRVGDVLFTLLGPMRMDYGQALAFMDYLQSDI